MGILNSPRFGNLGNSVAVSPYQITGSGSAWKSARMTGLKGAGKHYFEVRASAGSCGVGIGTVTDPISNTWCGNAGDSIGAFLYGSGAWWTGGVSGGQTGALSVGTWYGIAVDLDALTIRLYSDTGTPIGAAASIPAGQLWAICGSVNDSSSTLLVNTDANSPNTAKPAGFEYWSMGDTLSDRLSEARPVAYWKLDETTGSTAADATGNGHAAAHTSVTVGADPLAFSGAGSKAAIYDGSSSFTTLPASLTNAINGAPALSLAFEIEFPAFPASSYKGVYSVLVNGNFAAAYIAPQSDGTVLVGGRSQQADAFQFVTVPAGKVVAGRRHQMVAVFDYSLDAIRVHVDGALAVNGTGKSFGSSVLVMGSPNAHTLGSEATSKFACTVDDAAIFDYALTDADAYSFAARVAQSTYLETAAAMGAAAAFGFDETSGTTVADSSGNGLSGTATGGVTLNAAPLMLGGKALNFDGASGDVALGSPSALQITGPMSLATFVRPDSVSSAQPLYTYVKGSGPFNGVAFSLAAGGNVRLFINNTSFGGSEGINSTGTISAGQTAFIGASRAASGSVQFAINGANAGTGTLSETPDFTGLNAYFGFDPAGVRYAGALDGFLVFPYALTLAQFDALNWRATSVQAAPVTYAVAGTVKQGNQPAERTVRLYDPATGALIAETTSDAGTGGYSFTLETDDPVFVFGVPAEGYVPISRGPVVPVEQ